MPKSNQDRLLEEYLHDIYGLFVKRLAHFVLNNKTDEGDTVRLNAMLREIIKTKAILNK